MKKEKRFIENKYEHSQFDYKTRGLRLNNFIPARVDCKSSTGTVGTANRVKVRQSDVSKVQHEPIKVLTASQIVNNEYIWNDKFIAVEDYDKLKEQNKKLRKLVGAFATHSIRKDELKKVVNTLLENKRYGQWDAAQRGSVFWNTERKQMYDVSNNPIYDWVIDADRILEFIKKLGLDK